MIIRYKLLHRDQRMRVEPVRKRHMRRQSERVQMQLFCGLRRRDVQRERERVLRRDLQQSWHVHGPNQSVRVHVRRGLHGRELRDRHQRVHELSVPEWRHLFR